MSNINPDAMTKEEFAVRISTILAEAFLRYRTRQNRRKNNELTQLTTGLHSPLKRSCDCHINKNGERE